MPISLFWKEKIGLNEIQMGNMFAFIGVATVIVQGGLVGRLVKKFGETRLLTYGTYLFISSLLIIPWVTPETFIPIELIALAIMALANGCLTPSITSLLSKSADPKRCWTSVGCKSILWFCGPRNRHGVEWFYLWN